MTRYLYFVLIVLVLSGCEIKNAEDSTRSFLIVDQSSNKVLNNYEYDIDSNQLLRTESYNTNQLVAKSIDYEYDSSGNISKTVENSIGSPVKIIFYETENVYDETNRLIKTIRTSSKGEVIETFYGYDENGNLRGVVEQIDKSAVMMQDYDN